jgi:hypothetical protein
LGAGSESSSANPNRACPPERPSARRRGKLRHGNPTGDFLAAPRCGAQTRAACPCRQPAMANGRCRLHGGKSTGARTESGLARVRANRLVHGARTAEIIDLRSAAARHARTLRTLARLAKAPANPQSDQSTPCPATNRAPLQTHPAAFDRLRLRDNLRGTKNGPHPEPVEGRTLPIQSSERSTPCPATPPANPNGRLAHAESPRRGSSDAPHLRVSAPPRGVLSSERPSSARRSGLREGGSTPRPATARRATG